jgi:5,10-methylenetetrahydromethanopterin reductase
VVVGAGFTGRLALGQRAMRWRDVAGYVRVLRGLLRGEEVLWDGAVIKMLHPDGFVPARPIDDVPILIAADGPRGQAVARELGDGIMAAAVPPPGQADLPEWRAILVFGTVLDEGEPLTATRVTDAAGHGVAVGFHARYERGGAEAVDRVAGGRTWRQAIETVPEERRHLAIHEDHLVAVTERDRPAVLEGSAGLTRQTFSGAAGELRARVLALAGEGVTELIYQPAGPDVPGELERFWAALL